MEDDCWVGRGEFDHKQEGWKMTAGLGGVRLATSRGMEDDRWAERGEFDQSSRVEDDRWVGRGEVCRQ